MTVTKKRTKKLMRVDANVYVNATDLPDGWTARTLEYGEDDCSGRWESFHKPDKNDSWSWHRMAVGVLRNEELDVTLIVSFTSSNSCMGTGGKRGWKTKTVVRMRLDGRNHKKGELVTYEEIIGHGGWYERFTSKDQIEKELPKRYLHGYPTWKSKKKVVLAELVSIEVTCIKAATVSFSGTTRYKDGTGDGYRTFDRVGVEESFYGTDQEYPNLCSLIEEQIERVEKSRGRQAYSEEIPAGFGWSVTPEGKATIAKTLQAGGSKTFSPSGFGTAKVLSARPISGGSAAHPSIEKFFGVDHLYTTSYEMD